MKETSRSLEEATRWFAALRRNIMTLDERAEFDHWLSTEENRDALARVERAWRTVGQIETMAPPEHGTAPGRRVFLRRVGAALAGTALLGGAGGGWLLRRGWGERVETGIGEQREVTLSDGSVVRLNVKSALEWRVSSGRREVRMAAGDALFTVARDPDRPFVVSTGAGTVTVLGTVFEVSLRDGGGKIGVREGHVAFSPRAGIDPPVSLVAGQGVRFGARGVEPVHALPPDQVAEWEDHFVTFEHVPLAEVLTELGRYFPVGVKVEPPSAAARRLTLRLRLQDADSSIALLSGLLSARIERPGPFRYILRLAS